MLFNDGLNTILDAAHVLKVVFKVLPLNWKKSFVFQGCAAFIWLHLRNSFQWVGGCFQLIPLFLQVLGKAGVMPFLVIKINLPATSPHYSWEKKKKKAIGRLVACDAPYLAGWRKTGAADAGLILFWQVDYCCNNIRLVLLMQTACAHWSVACARVGAVHCVLKPLDWVDTVVEARKACPPPCLFSLSKTSPTPLASFLPFSAPPLASFLPHVQRWGH